MRLTAGALWVVLLLPAFLHAQCANDKRSNKKAGILVTDFTIAGTQTIGATELADIISDLIGSCFDENSEELEERVRASFQVRGYFAVEVKSLALKPRDPLAVPKPVALEADVSDGPRYKLGDITFLENHAFPVEKLREQFPLKAGDPFGRDKVASGLESLGKLYRTRGFLDYYAIPATELGSNATVRLSITIQEGPQYHMGKLDIVADKEAGARLRAAWNLKQGEVYDNTYVDQFLEVNRDLFPPAFSGASVQRIQNCPEAVVEVRLILDPPEDTPRAEPKSVPCKEPADASK